MSKAWIQTFNGHEVDLLNPRVEDVDAIDIAHSLSLTNRFTGHTTEAYSVAQHSVVGSILSEVIYPQVKWLPQEFLFHDAAEAYVGDVSSPLKSLLPGYREIEDKHRKVIEIAFAVSLGSQWEKLVDLRMLITEREYFMPETLTQWSVEEKPFTFEEFTASSKRFNMISNGSFWDWLWTPWSAEEAETRFLERMEKLKL
jgi:5'-deoxynucleotidase YfbR-like HD superfamily hydrolase